MLYSLSKLFGLNVLHSVNHYIFDPKRYLGEQLMSYWVIHGLLLVPFLFPSFYERSQMLFYINGGNSLLIYTLLTASLLTLVPFLVTLINDSISFDPVNLRRLILFSDGALSIFLKLWIITLPIAIFLKSRCRT